jgi:endonuclease YncB( thermonuclease family)
MGKSIFKTGNLVRGFSKIPEGRSVKETVHDGDTLSVTADGDFSIRFLGIDTPEVSLSYPELKGDPNAGKWKSIIEFTKYLSNPFDPRYDDFNDYKEKLGKGLIGYLEPLLNDNTAKNHASYAEKAQRVLEKFVQADLDERKQQDRDFRFFMAFSFEVMDRYGRFLCYLDRDNTKEERQERPFTYNERMIQEGFAIPYLIWPNIDPFIGKESIVKAVPDINNFQQEIEKSKRLRNAREAIRKVRESKTGLFDSAGPLMLFPFELRYLARRSAPDRYVLDLSEKKPKLIESTKYYKVENIEDRLFIPEEYVQLFIERGFQKE